jgi:thermitase
MRADTRIVETREARLRASALIIGLLLVSLAQPAAALHAPGPAKTTFIVGFYGTPPVEAGDQFLGAPVLRVNDAIAFALVQPALPNVFQAIAGLDPRVRYVEWNDPAYAHASLVPNDARYSDAGHYGTKKIGAEAAWDRTRGSTSVKVAVIDTGVRKTHEDLAGARLLQGRDIVNGDNNPDDQCGHGTHVTGTLGATIQNGKGIAGLSQSTILPVKALDLHPLDPLGLLLPCSASTADLADALTYAADQGAHVASNSWGGGGSSQALNDAIAYAHSHGVAVVGAAGNDGPCTDCVNQPWRDNPAKTIIVACTDSSDAQCDFSSEGAQVDVAAPGLDILSTFNGGDASYEELSGTSMSTPHVAGVLALVKAVNPTFGPDKLQERVRGTAKDLGATGLDPEFGRGRLDAGRAVY